MEKLKAKHNSKLVTILYVSMDLTWALVSEDPTGRTRKYKVDVIELSGVIYEQLEDFHYNKKRESV